MFRIQSAQQTNQDFSVGAYRRFDADGALAPVRTLGRVAASFMRHLLKAMHESRHKQAMTVLDRYRDLIDAARQAGVPISEEPAPESDVNGASSETGSTITPAVYEMGILCSLTGAPCEGDRAYLCDEWGCARKGGISPISHENA